MGHITPGHPFVEPKNHASKGITAQDNMGGNGAMSSFNGKSMKLGGGGRFAQGKEKLEKKGYPANNAAAIMAAAGRKKYGAKKMSKMAAAHR